MQTFDDDEFEGGTYAEHNIPNADDLQGSQNEGSEDEQEQNDDEVDQDDNDDADGDGDGDADGDGEDGGDDDDDEGEGDGEGDGDGDGDAEAEGDEDEENENDGEGNSRTADTPKRSGPPGAVPSSLGITPVLAPPVDDPSLDGAKAAADQPKTSLFPPIRPEALTALEYDIVPTIAAPQSTSINVVTATPDMRWVFSGGSDGYIRKFNWIDTANTKLALTVAQRQQLVDTISKAGVLTSYWENEDPVAKSNELGNNMSPVYALAVHSRALWLLSGCESGAINLQSIRHDEGKTQHRLKQHTSAVSVLTLGQDETSVLSGSWDKLVIDWDLNTGSPKRKFEGNSGQISSLEIRPLSSLPVPEIVEAPIQSTTMASDSAKEPRINGVETSGGIFDTNRDTNGENNGVTSPADSLFGGQDNDSLFGGGDDNNGGQLFGDDDDFSRAIASGITNDNDADAAGEVISDVPAERNEEIKEDAPKEEIPMKEEPMVDAPEKEPNSLPQAEDIEMRDADPPEAVEDADEPLADTIFLSSSFDGTLRIWDKRRQDAIAKITPQNVPPWCMGACWSPDGNFIYAGRRNGTVEEFSLHKGLRSAERTFRFPAGSGPVSAVRALPNGRHLVCASYDTLRIYDLKQQQSTSKPPFLVVPGHRTGIISQLYVDRSCRFMISTAGNRGWEGVSTQLLLGYEINI